MFVLRFYSGSNLDLLVLSQVIESNNPLDPQKVSYKQALVQDPGKSLPLIDEQKVNFNSPSFVNHYPDLSSLSDDHDILDFLASYLKDMTPFYHMYLIG